MEKHTPTLETKQYGSGEELWAWTSVNGTVQVTLLADGEARVKPLVIFKGQGRRIFFRETVRYDPGVRVKPSVMNLSRKCGSNGNRG